MFTAIYEVYICSEKKKHILTLEDTQISSNNKQSSVLQKVTDIQLDGYTSSQTTLAGTPAIPCGW